jgi:hypothetical protein
MTLRSFWLSLALVGCWSSLAGAQAVQLPSFSFFGVDTSVMAPDRGSAYIGGVRRVSSGSTAFGPGLGPRRAIGSSTSASQLRAKATIHDFAAHDEAHNEALLGNLQSSPDTAPARGDESSAARAPRGSLAEARRQYAAELAANDEAAQDTLAKARKSASDGKLGAARIFYKMAARDASADLRRKIEREIDALPSRSDSPELAATPNQAAKRPRAKSPKAGGPRGF